MDALEILFSLKRKGLSFAEIGRQLGVSRQAVRSVCKRHFRSISIANAIAQAIGKPRKDVFPEYE